MFLDQIMAMFRKEVAQDGERLGAFCDALQCGRAAEVEKLFAGYLNRTVSIRDTFVRKPTKENFYHGILLGILGYRQGWVVKSNQESGDGYSDIVIQSDEGTGIIIEVKYAEKGKLDVMCREALEQINVVGYAKQLKENDCGTILKYGIACYKKQCRVMMEKE